MQIKHGIVTEINEDEATAKVTFADEDDLVSYDLPVMHHSMGFAKFYSMPKIGMTALCGFLSDSGIEDGFILGSFYNEQVTPDKTGQVHYVSFEDGALIEYDSESKKMTLKSGGGGIFLDDNVTISKKLNVSDSVQVGTTVKSGGDMIAGGISQQMHTHPGVQSGSSNTGPAV